MTTRFWLAAMLSVLLAGTAVAQTVWNPNSPRGRRELQVNPPPQQPLPGQLQETIEPERWGRQSGQFLQPAWGTIGGAGWGGVTTLPNGAAPPR
jgi:hypothetical protein